MKKEVVKTQKVLSPMQTSVPAVKVGPFVFCTGQVGRFAETGRLGLGLEEQVKQTIQNIKTILEAAGTSLENVVKRTVYLRDGKDVYRAYKVIEELWPYPCASTSVESGLLGLDLLIEIEVIAVIPE